MTATEVFFFFLRKSLTPNERLAFTREIRNGIYTNDAKLCRRGFFDERTLYLSDLENKFAERLINNNNSWHLRNTLGKYGETTICTSLSSFMRYLLYYVPTIIGTSKKKNKYLERENISNEAIKKYGYKKYWQFHFIKKWHSFLKEYVINYDRRFSYTVPNNFKLKRGNAI